MQFHPLLQSDIVIALVFLVAISIFVSLSLDRKHAQKKKFDNKDVSLIKQTKHEFESMLNKHLQFPIAMG